MLAHPGSAHIRTGSETSVIQKSKQVTVASSTTPLEIYDGLYSKPYFMNQTFEDQIFNDDHEENGMEIITISKRISDVNFWMEGKRIYRTRI